MESSWRHRWLVALLLAAGLAAGCGRQGGTVVTPKPPVQSGRAEVVATIEQQTPGDALRLYLHGWMLRYNERALGQTPGASDFSWTPEKPDDLVSVVSSVPLTDFQTVSAWSASINALGPVSKTHAAYRADFTFWRGSPLSSAGTGAVSLSSSATYDLSWNEGKRAWAITQTSDSPDSHLVGSPRESTRFP